MRKTRKGFPKSRASYFRSARPHYTIWEPGTGYANSDVASILPRKLIPGRAEYLNLCVRMSCVSLNMNLTIGGA